MGASLNLIGISDLQQCFEHNGVKKDSVRVSLQQVYNENASLSVFKPYVDITNHTVLVTVTWVWFLYWIPVGVSE